MPLRRHQTTTEEPLARRARLAYGPLLLVILVLAAVLRFVGLDWDDGYYLHPDERFMVMVTTDTAWPDDIGQYFDSETSPLNPYNTSHGTFVYGTFPVFVTKAISGLFGTDFYGEMHLVGRTLSALADTGTVFLVAWIGRRFFGDRAGLLAGFLIAFTMLHIQSAHFYTVDAMSVFFATASFAAVVKGWDRKSIGWYAVAGVMIGLAGASKPNYLIAIGFLALPVLETIRLHGIEALIPSSRRRLFPIVPAVIVAGLMAFWTFRIAQPYAFSGPHIWSIGLNRQWVDDLTYWNSAQSGLIDIKSSVQWVGRTPIAYIVENMVRWGMGPPLGLAALAALILGAYRLLTSRQWPSWWFTGMIVWSLAQLVLYGTNIAQAQRYLLPIYPFLIVAAAGLLIELARRVRQVTWTQHLPAWANPGAILIAVTMIYTAFFGVAFDSLYVRPLSRVQASEWIYENVPEGSTLTAEYWDDALPMSLEGEDRWAYNVITLDLYGYEGPDNTKLSKIIGQLNQADYIVLSSNRIIESVPRQPERYPMATHYYDMLLSGDLGFDLVAEFSQTPELFGITLDDTNAEETITVYEHPYVRIFQKTERFDIARVYGELDAALGHGGVNYLPGDPVGDQMFLTQAEQEAYSDAGTWSDIYDSGDIGNRIPALWWYIGMQLMAVPAIPLAWVLFRRFPDGGYAIAKLLGLLLITWMAWMLSSTGLLPFGRVTILVGWALLAIASLLVTRKHLEHLRQDFVDRWGWIVATETIFLAAFTGMMWLHSHNTAFWTPGGEDETPFYVAMFNSAVRSTSFPPFDAWLSGGQLHFPYWGIMPWVLLTRLTGVVPNVAYTLAFAGIFALLCVTLWSATSALISRMYRPGRIAGWLGLLSPIMVGLSGTLVALTGAAQGMWGYPIRPADWLIGGKAGDVLYGLGNVLTKSPNFSIDIIAGSSGLSSSQDLRSPLSALVNGDLSPDATTLPLLAMALATAVAIVLSTECSSSHRRGIAWAGLGTILLGGGIVGAMSSSATWGFIVSAALMGIAVIIRAFTAHGRDHTWKMTRQVTLEASLLLATAMIAFLPFSSEFVTTGRNTTSGPTLSLVGLALTVGGFIAIIAIYLLVGTMQVVGEARHEGLAGRLTAGLTVLIAVSGLVAAILLESALLLLIIALLFVAIALWHRLDQPVHVLVLGLTGLGLVMMLYAPLASMPMDPFGGNSAAGMWVAAWTILGMAAAAVLVWLITGIAAGRSQAHTIVGSIGAIGSMLLIVALIASSMLTVRMVTSSSTTRALDTTAFLATSTDPAANAADLAATRWMMENIEGLPVIIEAPGWDHQYGGRVSAMTGFPTVIGWSTPERMTRPGWEQIVPQRQDAVNRIYSATGDFTAVEPLLVQYDVDLIYIGSLERRSYDDLALQKFEVAAEIGVLEVLYEQDGVTIYRYVGGVG